MTVVEQLSAVRDDEADIEARTPGADPGQAETWEITRFRCPDCHRPIAVLDNEERFPQHAVVTTPWHPFSATVCQGSGRWLDDADEEDPLLAPEPSLAEFLTLPPELDWRRQPFSHVRKAIPSQRQAA
jgi:hypothetical protein